jgi:uncharacterized protein
MDKAAAVEIANRFKEGLEAKQINVQRLILFGSYAIDAGKEGSDIDLVVISSDFEKKNYWERIDILTDAMYEIFAPVEATAMTPEEWDRGDSLIVDFARDGEVLYTA